MVIRPLFLTLVVSSILLVAASCSPITDIRGHSLEDADFSQLVPGQPLTLRVVGTALAGKAWAGTVAAGECVKIMTGAIMPAGLDTVVPQEFTTSTTSDGAEHITIAADVLQLGDNRRFKGEDLMEGGDVHLISMKHEVLGMLVPSKLYGALAAGRPCLFIGPENSETAKVIHEFGAGTVIPQGQYRKLAAEILKFRNDGNAWFSAQNGALKASEQFVPSNSFSSWIKGARETIRSRVA